MSDRAVDVVVVAYHAAAQLAGALGALGGEFPVIVIDNSSSTAVADVAERSGATYVDSLGNRGFAAGVNLALERLSGGASDMLLLNPDAMLDPSGVRELAEFLHAAENARVAAVAPRLREADGSEQRVAWPFPTPARMWAEAAGLGWLPARQTFVVGAVLLLRREAIESVGRFDERFFLYAEETDWQRRARAAGWRSAVCGTVVANHIGAGSSTSAGRREALFHAAQETYIRKWHGTAGWWLYRSAACAGAALRAALLTRERRRDAARRLHLYLRGPCRCAALRPE